MIFLIVPNLFIFINSLYLNLALQYKIGFMEQLRLLSFDERKIYLCICKCLCKCLCICMYLCSQRKYQVLILKYPSTYYLCSSNSFNSHTIFWRFFILYKNINMSQRKLKQKRIKKGYKKQKNEQLVQDNQHNEPDVDVQTNKPESIQEVPRLVLKYEADPNLNDDISEYKIIKPLLRPLKQVATLQPEVRSKLREQHNHIAEYVFLTQREKSKYFHEKNLKYNRTMQMPGSLAARKISFKRDFEVRRFSKEDAPNQVKLTKSSRDKYNQKIHYS